MATKDTHSPSNSAKDEETFDGRTVYLPLSDIVSCNACNKSAKQAKLRQCTACGEVLYCSTECQQKDWKDHKIRCGKTDRIDVGWYYPFLACLAYVAHLNPEMIRHPALERRIISSEFPIVSLPDGTSTRLILLGEKISLMSIGSSEWWPSAPSDQVRSKLFRRIVNEGFLLPNLLSICIALVSEMYTTTARQADDAESGKYQLTGKRRVRLTYNHSPIADFGIVQGSVAVTNGDRMAYFIPDEDHFQLGQNPDEHYRIYIKTLAGDEYYLDFGMHTFNFALMVDASKYCRFGLPDLGTIPAYFMGKDYDKVKVDMLLFKPRRRVSVLRDTRVHDLVRSWETEYCECHDTPQLFSIMDEIAGKKCSADEKKMLMLLLPNAVKLMRLNMKEREYMNFPKEPLLGIDTDPGEEGLTRTDDPEQQEAYNYLAKQARKLKKGKITRERWEKAYHEWAKNI